MQTTYFSQFSSIGNLVTIFVTIFITIFITIFVTTFFLRNRAPGYWDYWRNLFCRVVLARGRGFRAMDIQVDALNSQQQKYNLEAASQV